MARKRKSLAIPFILVARSIVVGVAYYLVSGLPGVTSSFVAIFVGFLAFDLIVAMPKFSLRLKHWKSMVFLVLPRISATAIALAAGLAMGIIFGALTKIGLPVVVGAVLSLGLSYNIANAIKGNISGYVGMISGIAMFDEIVHLEALSEEWILDLAGPAAQVFYGTFMALVLGWFVGVVVGSITRLFLPRGYRSVKSQAYNQPLRMRSFRDVTQLGDDMVVLQVEVDDASPLAYQTLGEANIGSELGIHVVSLIRSPEEVISPRGEDIILPTDQLVVVAPVEQTNTVIELTKGRVRGE